jgi:hypothetical protein
MRTSFKFPLDPVECGIALLLGFFGASVAFSLRTQPPPPHIMVEVVQEWAPNPFYERYQNEIEYHGGWVNEGWDTMASQKLMARLGQETCYRSSEQIVWFDASRYGYCEERK